MLRRKMKRLERRQLRTSRCEGGTLATAMIKSTVAEGDSADLYGDSSSRFQCGASQLSIAEGRISGRFERGTPAAAHVEV